MTATPHNRNAHVGRLDSECFGCKAATITVAGSAMPTRMPECGQQKEFVAAFEKDGPAYKRLRKQGYQPKSVKGAAEVEHFAQSKFEVESGHRLSSAAVGKKFDEWQGHFSEGGLVPINTGAE